MSNNDVKYLTAKIKMLEHKLRVETKKNEILRHAIDSHSFCPDCRDKMDGHCFRCRYQAEQRKNEELRRRLEEMKSRAMDGRS